MKKENAYIDFTSNPEQEIKFDQNTKKIVLNNFEIAPSFQLNVITINLEFVYINDNKFTFPISIRFNNKNSKDVYIPNYSFDMSKVKTVKFLTNQIMPIKVFYNLEKTITYNLI